MHIKRVGYLYNSINQTSEDVVVTVRYAVYTLQLPVSERDFFKANSSAKVVSKVRNVPKKIRKQNIRELFQTTSNFFIDSIMTPVGVQRF